MESIKRRWRQFEFVCEEALASITRSWWMSWVVIITMAASLSILGGFWFLAEDLQGLAQAVGSKVEITVFLKDEASPTAVRTAIEQMPGVAAVDIITREQAWRDLQAELKSDLRFDNLLDNPLPNTLMVKMKDPANTPAVADTISHLTEVEDLKYGRELLAKIHEVAQFTRLLGLIITALLFAATLAVIGNTIRLAVQNRRREIEIMQLVGASEGFVHWPFLLEGIFFGAAGALITSVLLFAWRAFIVAKLQQLFPFIPLEVHAVDTLRILGYLAGIGVTMGALGSLVSVGRFMKPRAS